MLKIKKIATTILMLSAGYVHAGAMGPVCQTTSLTLPCHVHEWLIGGQALYMQMPTNNNFANSTLTGSAGSIDRSGVPKWNWGFQLEGAYRFSNGKDIDLNWYHLRGSDSGALPSPVYLGSVFNLGEPTGTTSPFSRPNTTVNTFDSHVNSGWDMVNIEHGRHINFDEDFHARIHFGGEFSRVAQNFYLNNRGTSGLNATSYRIDTSIQSVFNGFGPRLGLDLVYAMQSGLGFYGKGAVGLLAGTSKTNYLQTNTENITTGYYLNDLKVVTSTDAKLGMNYMHDLFQGQLTLDLGWMWVNYLNPLSYKLNIGGAGNSLFGIQGVYFGAKWAGELA